MARQRPPIGDKPMMPPTFMMIAVGLMVLVHIVYPLAGLAVAPVTWLGAPFIGAGLILNFWADRLFRKRRTTVKPFRDANLIVEEGPFLFSRNPMYLGMVLAAIGIAMLLGTLSPFLIVGVLVWLLTSRFIAVEETMLEDKFGDDYRAYKKRVRRWV
jgi:protein-S-isoprenylcysteine O-methyltransferase Ste14